MRKIKQALLRRAIKAGGLHVALLVLAAILLSACGSEAIRSPKPRSDWSRGLRMGTAAGFAVPSLNVDPDGTAHIAWTAETAPTSGKLGYNRLSPAGVLEKKITYTVPERHLRDVTLRDADGALEICWNSDEGVRCSGLESDTTLTPYTLIPAQDVINTYAVAGPYYAWITSGDLFLAGPDMEETHLAENAVNLQLNKVNETLLVLWMEAKTEAETIAWLAVLEESQLQEPMQVGRITAGVLSGMRQHGLGATIVDDDQVCVFYDVEFTRGLEGGTAYTEFGCYEGTNPTPTTAQRLAFSIPDELEYKLYTGPFSIDRLAVPTDLYSDYTYYPSIPIHREGELAVALSTPARRRAGDRQQIAMAILKNGELLGFQPISASMIISFSPTLAIDEQGNLYAAWLERTAVSEVFLATTNPVAAEALNVLDAADIGERIVGVVVEALTGLILLPFALIALLISFVSVGLGAWVTRILGFEGKQDLVGFAVGVVILWAVKLIMIPQITTYLPFARFLPEFSSFASFLWQLFWPLFIIGLSLFASERLSRRWDLPSLSVRFGLYGVLDLVLTSLIYGAILQTAM